MRPSLKIVEEEGGPARDVELPADEVVIGRAGDCTLMVSAPSVSRRHARLVWAAGTLTVEDLGSANGTRVNGAPISGAVTLHSGDRVVFGKVQAEVVLPPPPEEDDATVLVSPSSGEDDATVLASPPPPEPAEPAEPVSDTESGRRNDLTVPVEPEPAPPGDEDEEEEEETILRPPPEPAGEDPATVVRSADVDDEEEEGTVVSPLPRFVEGADEEDEEEETILRPPAELAEPEEEEEGTLVRPQPTPAAGPASPREAPVTERPARPLAPLQTSRATDKAKGPPTAARQPGWLALFGIAAASFLAVTGIGLALILLL